MTKDQWVEIRRFVKEKLGTENPFAISSESLKELFGIENTFFDEMNRFAQEDKPGFRIRRTYCNPDNPDEDIFDIVFSR